MAQLRFWLGWLQELAGDHAAAQESWRQARSELESFLKEQPENLQLIGDLALTNMGLGDKAAALALLERAMAAMPIEKDAVRWWVSNRDPRTGGGTDGRTRPCHRRFTESNLAPVAGLSENLPLTPALLRLDPMFDPLRNDPRFQKLVAAPGSK